MATAIGVSKILFVVGLIWNFVVLEGQHYCISKTYNADDEEVFILFKMLKNLKSLIKNYTVEN